MGGCMKMVGDTVGVSDKACSVLAQMSLNFTEAPIKELKVHQTCCKNDCTYTAKYPLSCNDIKARIYEIKCGL